jgi:hypothetical protein
MKCDYCGDEDHLVSACRAKMGDRGKEIASGCILIFFLGLAFIVGCIMGAISGAFMHGYRHSVDLWAVGMKRLRGKKDEPSASL